MAHTPPNTLALWGFLVWGDFADLTLWMDHYGQVVVAPKTWPKKPPSPDQEAQRLKFAAAAAAWSALTPAVKQQWMLAARRASLCMHGLNLFYSWHMTGDSTAIRTIERQTSTNLLP